MEFSPEGENKKRRCAAHLLYYFLFIIFYLHSKEFPCLNPQKF